MISQVKPQVRNSTFVLIQHRFSTIKYNLAPGAYQSIEVTNSPAFSFGIKSDLNKPNSNPGNLI